MENRQIRKRAFRLYQKNRKLLLAASLAMQGASILQLLFLMIAAFFPLVAAVPEFVITVLTYPLTLGGMLVMFRLWNGAQDDPPRISTIFTYFRTGKRFLSALWVGLVLLLMKALASIIYFVGAAVAQKCSIMMSLLVLLVFMVVYFVALIWLSGSLFLYPYLYLNGNEASPIRLGKESFQRMKGNVSPWIGFWFGLGWWGCLLLLIYMIAMRGIGTYLASAAAGGIVFAAASGFGVVNWLVLMAFYCLILPYWGLACVGFAEDLLPPAGKSLGESIPGKRHKSSENR